MSKDDSLEWSFPYTLGRFYAVIHKPQIQLRIMIALGAKDSEEFERLLKKLIMTFYEKRKSDENRLPHCSDKCST